MQTYPITLGIKPKKLCSLSSKYYYSVKHREVIPAFIIMLIFLLAK